MLTLLLIVGASLIAYAALLLLAWRFQEQIAFQPPRRPDRDPVPARQVGYRAADGTHLFSYVVGDAIGDESAGKPVVLAFHGNADLARWLVPWATEIARRASAVVIIPEYRGYDGLDGTTTYVGTGLDARAALANVRATLGVERNRLFYFGHSLGSAIATELAAEAPPRALILESPFTSARAMARRMGIPGLAWLWTMISRIHYDSLACVGLSRCPVWVAHGSRDHIIPTSMGRAIFAAAAEQGELLLVEGAGHNDVAFVAGEAYWRWLERAVRT